MVQLIQYSRASNNLINSYANTFLLSAINEIIQAQGGKINKSFICIYGNIQKSDNFFSGS